MNDSEDRQDVYPDDAVVSEHGRLLNLYFSLDR
jgi:hypothetical protein